MGGISTVFNLDKHRHELLRLTQQQTAGLEPGEHEDENDIVPFYEETKAKADELITDTIAGIDPYDFQELVAGILQVMG